MPVTHSGRFFAAGMPTFLKAGKDAPVKRKDSYRDRY